MATNYEIAAARNPKWSNPEKNMIDIEVDFTPLDEDWVEYTCSPTDVVDHSRTLYTNALAGQYGTIAEYEHHTLWTPYYDCLLYTSPSPRDVEESRMPSSA